MRGTDIERYGRIKTLCRRVFVVPKPKTLTGTNQRSNLLHRLQAGLLMNRNRIVVKGPIDYEDAVEGGNFLYEVVSCKVGPREGTLVWDKVIFPAVPVPIGRGYSDVGPMISRGDPVTNHVSTMQCVGDDVLSLLRERGVEVIIRCDPSPAVTSGD